MKTNFLYHLPDLSKRGTKLSPGPESVGSCFHDFFPRNYHFVGFFWARESSHNGFISFFKENYNFLKKSSKLFRKLAKFQNFAVMIITEECEICTPALFKSGAVIEQIR